MPSAGASACRSPWKEVPVNYTRTGQINMRNQQYHSGVVEDQYGWFASEDEGKRRDLTVLKISCCLKAELSARKLGLNVWVVSVTDQSMVQVNRRAITTYLNQGYCKMISERSSPNLRIRCGIRRHVLTPLPSAVNKGKRLQLHRNTRSEQSSIDKKSCGPIFKTFLLASCKTERIRPKQF